MQDSADVDHMSDSVYACSSRLEYWMLMPANLDRIATVD